MAKQSNTWFIVSMILIGVLVVGGIFGLITFGEKLDPTWLDKSCQALMGNSDALFIGSDGAGSDGTLSIRCKSGLSQHSFWLHPDRING